MNRKAINAVLKKKLNDWVSSIDDKAIQSEIKENSIITGGAIASMLMNEPVKDFDVYFNCKESARNVAWYYIEKFNATHKKKAFLIDGAFKNNFGPCEGKLPKIAGLHSIINTLDENRIRIVFEVGGVSGDEEISTDEPFEDVYDQIGELDEMPEDALETKEKYRPIFMSPNAITLSNKIQIVIRFHGTPDEIHGSYDYIHCMNYWTPDGKLVLKQEALESILSKHLIYNGSKYPVCSVVRMRKFIKRGWHINAGQILKMLFQISELDLTDVDVLEDQLIGVDTAYFMQLIASLRKRMEDEEFTLTFGYVSSIIDKIFN